MLKKGFCKTKINCKHFYTLTLKEQSMPNREISRLRSNCLIRVSPLRTGYRDLGQVIEGCTFVDCF